MQVTFHCYFNIYCIILLNLVAYLLPVCLCVTFSNALSRYDKGGHLFLPSYIMRTHGSRKQQDVMKNVNGAQMQKVFEVVYEISALC